MKKVLLILAVVLFAWVAYPAGARKSTPITVENADSNRVYSVSSSNELDGLLAAVAAHVQVEMANAVKQIGLSVAPAALTALLDDVDAHVAIQHANSVVMDDLNAPSASFQSLLDAVENRVLFQFSNAAKTHRLTVPPTDLSTKLETITQFISFYSANAAQTHTLAFPTELINDDVRPTILTVNTNVDDVQNPKISWSTDEYSIGSVHYGTVSGVYTGTVTSELYALAHEVTLENLSATTWYYQVSSTDRSGNNRLSSEHSFEIETDFSVFIPIVIR